MLTDLCFFYEMIFLNQYSQWYAKVWVIKSVFFMSFQRLNERIISPNQNCFSPFVGGTFQFFDSPVHHLS